MKSAEETIPNQTGWKQTFDYDRYGNRSFNTTNNNTTTIESTCPANICNPQAQTPNNKFSTTDGYAYDASGNLKTDAQGKKFTYDGENKQTKVETVDQNNNVIATNGIYYYDGEGKRVKKVVPGTGETTIFIYDASGKMVAEYSTQVATGTDAKVSYLTADHLGSPRITTDRDGKVISRRDFMPFGEEITAFETPQRLAGLGYVGDNVRQKFTGYEKDDETGLDFAQARMYINKSGRFTTIDPYNIVLEFQAEIDKEKAQKKFIAYLSKPQQWNRYTYVTNNPMVYTDPSGEVLVLSGSKEDNEKIYKLLQQMVGQKGAKNLTYKVTDDGKWIVDYKKERGGLAIGGEMGVRLEDIIDSTKTVSMKITNTDVNETGFGNSVNIAASPSNGAWTGLSQDNQSVSILIHSNVVKIANNAFQQGAGRRNSAAFGSDGNILTTTLSVAISHELGHAYSFVKDNYGERYDQLSFYESDSHLEDESKKRSVDFENLERQRLGMALRREH